MHEFPTNLVSGYHGTSDIYSASILRDGFKPSKFEGDWLGNVVYFWEGDEERAAEWACRVAVRDGGSPVVIRATIDISDCFDLTIRRFKHQLRTTAEAILADLTPEQRAAIRQSEGRRELDCRVINSLLRGSRRPDGSPRFSTIRAAFREGEPIFAAGDLVSGVYSDDHLQVGVFDLRAIEDIDLIYVDLTSASS